MYLTYRSVQTTELAALFQPFGLPFAYAPDIRAAAPALWEQYARQGSLIATLFEDIQRRQVMGISIEIFIHEAFLEEIQEQPKRRWREEILHRELAGQSVVLTLEEAQYANQHAGLNLFFLNDPLPPQPLSVEEFRTVDVKWGEALYDYRACNLKSIIWECYSEQAHQMGLSCGMKLHPHSLTTASEQHPSLLFITRDEALAQYGTHVSQMFIYAPPRFSFTSGQQALLRQALVGATDEELAETLYLSLSAIKKRWFAIYDRVRQTDPFLLPEQTDLARQTRGIEKRRYLLSYLRDHPEELHPINALP